MDTRKSTTPNRGLIRKINRRSSKVAHNKIRTNDPQNPQQKYDKTLRKKLTERAPSPQTRPTPVTTLSLGSININGLDMEATWAIEQLIKRYSLEVSVSIGIFL